MPTTVYASEIHQLARQIMNPEDIKVNGDTLYLRLTIESLQLVIALRNRYPYATSQYVHLRELYQKQYWYEIMYCAKGSEVIR